MRRRGRHKSVISLFAFQDVMASVIGILFFLVLLMSLDIVDQQAPAASIEIVTAEDYGELQDETNNLRETLEYFQEEIEKIVSDTNLASIGDEQIFNKVTSSYDTLTMIYGSIEEQQKQILSWENKSKKQKHEYNDALGRIQQLEPKLVRLRGQLRLAESRPPIAYIIDRDDPAEPWLLELTDKAIRVAASDGFTTVLEFTADTFVTRKLQFLDWARSQNSSTHYCVILKKPSGLRYAGEIEKGIKELGFEIGTDLVPEEYMLF